MPARISQSQLEYREYDSDSIFSDLPLEARRDFESIGMRLHLPKGTVLFQQGDPGTSVSVLYEGQVKLQSTLREGKSRIHKIAVPGDVLGLGALISGNHYDATAETLQSTIVTRIRRDEFISFLGRHKHARIYAARVLSEEHKSSFFDTSHPAAPNSASGRLAAVLLDLSRNASHGRDYQRFTLLLTHGELAHLAGTSRETVTRMLSRFRREGWIRVQGCSMTILAPDRLIRLIS